MSVLDHANVAKMDISRSAIKWIRVRIYQRTLRGRSWRYDPLPACDLGLEEAVSQDRNHGDRIEDEDQQHHRVGQGDVQLVIGDRDHQLETDPVEQRQGQVEFGIPWTPEPIGSARRRRLRDCLVHLTRFGNFLHEQSLSGKKNSTDHDGAKPSVALACSDEATHSCDFLHPAFLPPLLIIEFHVSVPAHFAHRQDARP